MVRFHKRSRRVALHVSLALLVGATPAFAQASDATDVYLLRFAREVADGRAVVSTSHDMLVARGRRGDRSMMLHDIQAGAVTIEREEGTGSLSLQSERGVDASHGYDYGTRQLSGTGSVTPVFNRFLRPLLLQGPALGRDAAWSISTGLSDLGLDGDDRAPLTIGLQREYFANSGQQVVLVEFEIPAFTYNTPEGAEVVHWSRGFAVTDPSFAEVHALVTQHRAAVTEADGRVLPFSVRTSVHSIDRVGGWRMNFADAPAVRGAVERVVATAGDPVHTTTSGEEAAPMQPYPAIVAARLDLAALALGENGANPLPSVLGSGMETAPDAVQMSEPSAATGDLVERRIHRRRVDPAALEPAEAASVSSVQDRHSLIVRMNTEGSLEQAYQDFLETSQDQPPDSTGQSPGMRTRMLEGLDHYIENDYSMMTLNPDDQAFTYRTAESRELNDTIRVMMESTDRPERSDRDRMLEGLDRPAQQSGNENPGFTYRTAEERELGDSIGAMRESTSTDTGGSLNPAAYARQKELLRNLRGNGDDVELRSVRQEMLQGLDSYTPNDYSALRLQPDEPGFTYRTAEARNLADPMEVMRREAARLQEESRSNLPLRLTPRDTPDDAGPPPWMQEEWRQDPSAREADDTMYRLLRAELEREAAEARRDERRRQQRADSGIDSLDEFVRNNAFDYTSMVGVVATDLSRWDDWLATQNVRELERLSRLIGYPNLASALTDASSLIRQSQDEGFRRWAMQAPRCGGTVGCGPSYLERWWAKQSVVLLGDVLADSREVFSSGGFSDIGIAGVNLGYLLRDHAAEDGDIINVRISQFGRVVYEGEVSLTNAGEQFTRLLKRGVASLDILALNEGSSSPNTAQITVDDVVRGEATQTYSLSTGETATLRIEIGAGQD